MTTKTQIADQFELFGRIIAVRRYGSGLINNTFLVTTDCEENKHVILQCINRFVFSYPEQVMENMQRVVDHVMQHQVELPEQDFRLPTLFRTKDGKSYVKDQNGEFWRAMGFIENTRSFETLQNIRQAEEVGYAVGKFQRLLSDLNPFELHDTLPGFHVTPQYLAQYDLLGKAHLPDTADIQFCRKAIDTHREFIPVLERAKEAGQLILRVIHGDPKLNNILFDEQQGRAVSIIDLDTVKPGLIHYDVGDCLRSSCNLAGESPDNDIEVTFDMDVCRAILQGYVAEAADFLNDIDYAHIYDAICLLPLELGLRFFTDFIAGNKYFKVDTPDQNLYRAITQFQLLQSIEKQEAGIRLIIKELAD